MTLDLYVMPEILHHTIDCVTSDLFPSNGPSCMQCCDVGSAHSPAFPIDEYMNDQPLQGLRSSCYFGSWLCSSLTLEPSHSLMVLGTLASPLDLGYLSLNLSLLYFGTSIIPLAKNNSTLRLLLSTYTHTHICLFTYLWIVTMCFFYKVCLMATPTQNPNYYIGFVHRPRICNNQLKILH